MAVFFFFWKRELTSAKLKAEPPTLPGTATSGAYKYIYAARHLRIRATRTHRQTGTHTHAHTPTGIVHSQCHTCRSGESKDVRGRVEGAHQTTHRGTLLCCCFLKSPQLVTELDEET